MKSTLLLFFKWGIKLDLPFEIRPSVIRKLVYADKEQIEKLILQDTFHNRLEEEIRAERPMIQRNKSPFVNISKAMKLEKAGGEKNEK